MTTTKTTTAFSAHAVICALYSAEDVLKQKLVWNGKSGRQKKLIETYFTNCCADADILPELLRAASRDNKELNAFLEKHKSKLRFDKPFPGNQFGTVGLLRLGGIWAEPGKPMCDELFNGEFVQKLTMKTKSGEKKVDGVRMKQKTGAMTVLELSTPDDDFVSRITMENGDVVSITKLQNMATGYPEEVMELAIELRQKCINAQENVSSVTGVEFPMVDYSSEVDVSWLKGIFTNHGSATTEVIEAKMFASLKLNHIAAKATADVGLIMRTTVSMPRPKTYHRVDGNFLVTIERPTAKEPILFAAHVLADSWKNPGIIDLSDIPKTREVRKTRGG